MRPFSFFSQGHVYLVFFGYVRLVGMTSFLPNHTFLVMKQRPMGAEIFALQRATVRTWFYAIAPSVRTCSMAVIASQMMQMHVKPYVRRSVRMGGF